jgi:predicted Zn-dependent peptidase
MIPKIVHSYSPKLIEFNSEVFQNGNGYFIEDDHTNLIRIVLLFNAGSFYQDLPLQAQIFSSLLNYETKKSSHVELNHKFEQLGANVSIDSGKDDIEVEILILEEYAEKGIDLLFELLFEPSFSKEGYNLIHQRLKAEYQIRKQKGGAIAQKELTQSLFSGHNYGRVANDEDFEIDLLSSMDSYYEKFINALSLLVVTGKQAEKHYRSLLNRVSGCFSSKETMFFIPKVNGEVIHVNKLDAEQDSIRVGGPAVNRKSLDYPLLTFANLVFGGYHSARLFSRLREDLGLTYGAYSSIIHHVRSSHIQMSMDVQKGSSETVLEEIKGIIDKLQTEMISKEELERSKTYIMGNLLQGFDGVFDQMDQLIICHKLGVDYHEHFNAFFDDVANIQVEDLPSIFHKYYNWDNLNKVIVSAR